ncbi:Acylamidase [Achromobacter anxifer]|uniref:Acylamidase n=1 Tax=Achromobacter anxifer TaxID=1287737 RepID=A0A6S7EU59_9BURK|nr:amidase [Achromobacter anxifer]CAB3923598.1 Acylamidase [Achromobacter anxifer]
MSDSLCELSAVEAARLIRARSLSPVELVRASLERAERLQPVLNCFITLCPEQAMAEARRAEAALMRGDAPGLLHGLPFTVKDLVNTAGVRTTFGALPFRDNVPAEDAVAVARLREQGAILIGKTTTPEFGSKSMTDSPLFGQTRNAWNLERTCGGSSGGAAAATAAGITALAVASDGGGSTRIPAACNGVVGFKQSLGAIPHSQAQDAIGNQTYVTPTTRTVADTRLMMAAMAGPHDCDPWSLGVPKADYANADAPAGPGTLCGKRIRYCAAPPGRPVDAGVRRAFEAALARLAGLGAEIEPFDGAGFDVEPVWRVINHTVWRARFLPLIEREPEAYSPTFRRQIASAAQFSAQQYQEAMFARTALYRKVQALLGQADLLAMPTMSRTALPLGADIFDTITIDGRAYDDIRAHWYPWTMLFNLTGHPAISVPCGLGDDGMPVGLQLVARSHGDLQLLQAAEAYELAGAPLPRPLAVA